MTTATAQTLPANSYGLIIRKDVKDEDDTIDHAKPGQKRKRPSSPSAQIWATFDFGVLEGVMRFLDAKAPTGKTYCESDLEIRGNGPPPKPSNSALNYRWRGRETGESVISLYSDRDVQRIDFTEYGTVLTGTFQGDVLDKVEFTGLKIGPVPLMPSSRRPQVRNEWERYSEEEYERARVGRWG